MVNKKEKYNGFAAIMMLLIVTGLVLIVTFSVSTVIFVKKQMSRNVLASAQSYYSAESGLEDAILRVVKDYNYTAVNSFTLDNASISQTVAQNGNNNIIDSESVYGGAERKVETSLVITTSNVSFYYGVQVGQGGLTMGNGSTVTGNIYSDGTITGSNGAAITGDALVATGMSLDSNGDWENYGSDLVFGQNNPTIDLAMKFVPASSGALSQLSLYLKRTSSLPADGAIRIMKDSGGAPSNQLVDQLATITLTASKVGTTYGWINYSFSSPANLTAGTAYWIVLDIVQNNAKYFYIGKSSSNTDKSGYSSSWNGSPWTFDPSFGYEYKAWIGGQPTSLDGAIVGGNVHANSITNSDICGDAYYQTIDAASLNFLNNPTSAKCASPLTPGTAHPGSPDPAVQAMPISSSNIADWEAAALAGGIYSDAAHCSPTSDITIGPAKLACDFTPSNGIKMTLSGTVWVEGNVTISNNTVVQLASGYGSNSGEIVADKPGDLANSGTINVSNNGAICGSQGYDSGPNACYPSNGSYILLLSTSTSANAINVSNNSSGAIFYASAGTATVSNNANLKEVTAYKLNLSNNTNITYETGLASATFSTGPGAGWQINSWYEIQ